MLCRPAQIHANDFPKALLGKADRGVGTSDRIETFGADRVPRFFRRGTGWNHGQVEVRRGRVSFERLDLLDPAGNVSGPIEAVVCRRVLVWSDKPEQGRTSRALPADAAPGAPARCGTRVREVPISEIVTMDARRSALEAKVFGGGNVPRHPAMTNAGSRNARFVPWGPATARSPALAQDLARDDARKADDPDKVIVAGASTGGTEAIEAYLACMPLDCSGILTAEHTPEAFTRPFAKRLSGLCRTRIVTALRRALFRGFSHLPLIEACHLPQATTEMQTQVLTNAGIAKIVLNGRFDFGSHRDFKTSYEEPLGASDVRELEIDMGGVEYLDSSALGMLLILKERAGATNKRVAITNCRGAVKQVLDIANFGKLFPMR